MADRRGVEPLEPELGMGPVLREVGDRSAEDVPSLCVDLRRARMKAGYELADIATALELAREHLGIVPPRGQGGVKARHLPTVMVSDAAVALIYDCIHGKKSLIIVQGVSICF